MKLLIVGDYHAESSDLDDCRALADLIVSKAVEHQATVLFTGDQYNTHAIIHAEVQLFWVQFYRRLLDSKIPSISLIGNHDRPGSAHSKATAMLAHRDQTVVVHKPYTIHDRVSLTPHDPVFLFLPYYDDNGEFVKACNLYPTVQTIFCHATFDGSTYDNGFYAKDGVNPNLIKAKQIISGHIHAPQEFGKVWYVGSPRWRTLNDANTERAIWLVEFNLDGSIKNKTRFDTGSVCRKIYALEDRQEGGELLPKHLDPRHEWRIDIHGTADYIDSRSAILKGMGCKVRTFRTELEQPKVKESEGIDTAFDKWVTDFKPQHGTGKELLRTMLKERVGV